MVPVLSLGTGTFGGGKSEFFKAWGANNAEGATRLVDICLDAGLTMFDSSNIYSAGEAETILGQEVSYDDPGMKSRSVAFVLKSTP